MVQLLRAVTVYSGMEAYSIRQVRKITKAGTGAAAELWNKRFLSRHFITRAKTIYSYRRRSPKTLKKKERLAKVGLVLDGGRTALVHTGRLRAAMKRPKRIRVYPTRATIDLAGPKYFRTNYKPGRPNLAEEVTKVIPSEMQQIDKASEQAMDEQVKQTKVRKRRKT